MSRVIDALVAYRVLKLLVTPWKKTKAYELGIIDEKGKVLIKSKQIVNQTQRKAYTLLIRFVFNLKRLLQKVGLGGRIGTYAAAAIAFLKEEHKLGDDVEKELYKYLKENGFEFELNEQYGESLSPGTYKLKNDIYDLEGDIQLKQDDEIIIEEFKTNTILGYDVFKYNDVYLTTEDVYAN
tara:strand:- start:3853 stop:4395 length:543 start_codon:yes stop_codon:yes gene_type:complete